MTDNPTPDAGLAELQTVLSDFVNARTFGNEPPEDNEDWQRGFCAALDSLREELKPWWPFARPLDLTALRRPTATEEAVEAVANIVCRDVAELPDRSSPDDWPDAMLVTADELALIVARNFRAALASRQSPAPADRSAGIECHGLDTPERVCFYEQDFYVLSNFSAFQLLWKGLTFDTLEAAYHWEKFPDDFDLQTRIRTAPSAHEAFKIAGEFKDRRRADWDDAKADVMRALLRAKAEQHEYVRRKLLATGDRELVENSWRDDYWGWGPNRGGQNMLGKLWMEVRAELRALSNPIPEQTGEGEK